MGVLINKYIQDLAFSVNVVLYVLRNNAYFKPPPPPRLVSFPSMLLNTV